MALDPRFPIAPGTRPDPKFETVYDASRGGWYPPPDKPKEEAPKAPEKKAS
jgi:hypothetical protein